MKGDGHKECIVIAGSHRSGTSALTRLFGIAGAVMPATLIQSKIGNESGHWESQPIVDFNDVFLGHLSSKWQDCRPLDHEALPAEAREIYFSNMKTLLSEEYGDSSPIALKDPRICRFQSLTAESLIQNGYTPKFAIVTRNPLEVGRSIEARNNLPQKAGILIWLRHVLDAEFYSRGYDRGFATFAEVMRDPSATLKKLWDDLSITSDLKYSAIRDKLNAYVRPELRHHAASLEDLVGDDGMAEWVQTTYSILKRSSKAGVSTEDEKTLDSIRKAFNSVAPMLQAVFDAYEDKQLEVVLKANNLTAQLVDAEANKSKVDALELDAQEKAETLNLLQEELSQTKASNEAALKHNSDIEADSAVAHEALRQLIEEAAQAKETQESLSTEVEMRSQQAVDAAKKLEQSEAEYSASIGALVRELEATKKLTLETELGLKSDISALEETLGAEIERQSEENAKKSAALKSTKGKLAHRQRLISKMETLLESEVKTNAELSLASKKLKSNFTAHKRKSTQISKSLTSNLENERAAHALTEAIKTEMADTLTVNQKEIKDLSWRVDNLHGQLVAEMSSNSQRASQLEAFENSTFWKMSAFPRKLVNLWRKRTLFLVGLVAGKEARVIMSDSTGLEDAAMHSKSKSVSFAREHLTHDREEILDSRWLKYKTGVISPLSDSELPPITMSAVTYNSEKWLWDFFLSVEALDYPLEKVSINFVDNGSSDGTCASIKRFIEKNGQFFGELKLFERPNLGFGAGHDYGISKATDDFVLVTNVDMEFYPSSLREVANAAFYDDKDVACWELRQAPFEHPKYYDPVTMLTNWNAHACVLFRRAAYLKIGGYEKRIFMYGEDVELSYRFRANGFKLRYVPNAVVTHHVDMEDTTVRPHQLSGSSSANLLLRYRYGSAQDIIAGEAFFTAVSRNEHDPVRLKAWNDVKQALKKDRFHFLRTRKWRVKAKFPFREFDYDDARPGGIVPTRPYKKSEHTDMPLVTIVTRTHGPSDHFLRNCISSVLNQTYPNIEHIIVEDRTGDGEAIVEAASDIYGDRIRYMKSPGKGRSECGNYGASQARGNYICWLDNDDLFYADHIETLMRGFETKPLAVCSYALAWEALGDNVDGITNIASFNLPTSHAQPYSKERFQIENFIPIQAIVFKKDLFTQLGGFNPDLTYLEDWNLWARYAEMGDFVFTPRVTSMYVTPNSEQVRQARHMLLDEAYETVRKLTIDDTMKIRKRFFSEASNDSLQSAEQ